jgi:fermentation-respiration switch protein FrsA (DUF1100 family)
MGVLLFDYRGYGNSGGRPSEAGLNEDALAAYEFVRAQGVSSGGLVIVGQSLGNAPAAHVAAARPCAGLVLVSGFSSLPDVLALRLPGLPIRLVPWRVNRFDVSANLERVTEPVIIVSGSRDELVPRSHSRALAKRLGRRAEHVDVEFGHEGLLHHVVTTGTLDSRIRDLVLSGSTQEVPF